LPEVSIGTRASVFANSAYRKQKPPWLLPRYQREGSSYNTGIQKMKLAFRGSNERGILFYQLKLYIIYNPSNLRETPPTKPYTTESSSLLRCDLPFSLHGKCTTGMAKNEFEGSARPANMLYHAMKAATMPNAPPATVSPWCGCPSAVLRASRYAVPRQMKVIQTVKKSELKASVERMVRIHRRKVKMNQAKIWEWEVCQFLLCRWTQEPPMSGREYATNVESERGIKVDGRGICRFNLEAAWDEDDSKADPESTVGRQRSATKDVS
jgi:hypothetical protein